MQWSICLILAITLPICCFNVINLFRKNYFSCSEKSIWLCHMASCNAKSRRLFAHNWFSDMWSGYLIYSRTWIESILCQAWVWDPPNQALTYPWCQSHSITVLSNMAVPLWNARLVLNKIMLIHQADCQWAGCPGVYYQDLGRGKWVSQFWLNSAHEGIWCNISPDWRGRKEVLL